MPYNINTGVYPILSAGPAHTEEQGIDYTGCTCQAAGVLRVVLEFCLPHPQLSSPKKTTVDILVMFKIFVTRMFRYFCKK